MPNNKEDLEVYGFGERKAVEAFRNACNRFIYVENLTEPDGEKGGGEEGAGKGTEPPSRAVKIIATAIEGSDDDGWANLSDVGKRILAAAPDFDPRSYGCRNLSTLVEKSGGFEIEKGSLGAIRIRRKAVKRKAPGKAGDARFGEIVMAAGFAVGYWIERLAQLLPPLAQAQEPYLAEYQERHARVIDLRDGQPPPFPLDDLCALYDEVRHGRLWGMDAHYAPLRAVLDPVRHALLAHPGLERVAVTGRVIGDNDFWIQILGSGSQIWPGVLIAGLMARAADRSDDRIRGALRELNAFLSPAGDGAAADVLGNLDEACDVFLFYGLALSERIEVAEGMVLLPYGEVLRFVDRETVQGLRPVGRGIPRLAAGRSGGQAVPLAAGIASKGQRERAGGAAAPARRFSRRQRYSWTCWR